MASEVGKACPLCGGGDISGGLDLPGACGDDWVLVPPALKTLPTKLMPRFAELQHGRADAVETSPSEGWSKFLCSLCKFYASAKATELISTYSNSVIYQSCSGEHR